MKTKILFKKCKREIRGAWRELFLVLRPPKIRRIKKDCRKMLKIIKLNAEINYDVCSHIYLLDKKPGHKYKLTEMTLNDIMKMAFENNGLFN